MIEWNGFLSIKAPEGTEEYLNDYDRLILFPHGTFGSSFNILFLEDGADYPDDLICEELVDMMKQSYIRSDAEGITEINHIVHSDVSYAGVDNCYYCETDVQYSLGNGKSAMKIIVILVKQDTNVFTIALVSKAEETENVLLKMLDTITWK